MTPQTIVIERKTPNGPWSHCYQWPLREKDKPEIARLLAKGDYKITGVAGSALDPAIVRVIEEARGIKPLPPATTDDLCGDQLLEGLDGLQPAPA